MNNGLLPALWKNIKDIEDFTDKNPPKHKLDSEQINVNHISREQLRTWLIVHTLELWGLRAFIVWI